MTEQVKETSKRTLVGEVVSDKMDKSVTVVWQDHRAFEEISRAR
jgi:ribosomal protein S17